MCWVVYLNDNNTHHQCCSVASAFCTFRFYEETLSDGKLRRRLSYAPFHSLTNQINFPRNSPWSHRINQPDDSDIKDPRETKFCYFFQSLFCLRSHRRVLKLRVGSRLLNDYVLSVEVLISSTRGRVCGLVLNRTDMHQDSPDKYGTMRTYKADSYNKN